MNKVRHSLYGTWAPIYQERGLWPRPIMFGTKACKEPGWNKPDTELDPKVLQQWIEKKPALGIGLLMGTPLPDGTRLGALDIDDDNYTALGKALLKNPVSGRFGKKGAVFFVRYVLEITEKPKFSVEIKGSKKKQVAECLFNNLLCVIPPTIHPDTNNPYEWLGKPLHETDFNELPLIGE